MKRMKKMLLIMMLIISGILFKLGTDYASGITDDNVNAGKVSGDAEDLETKLNTNQINSDTYSKGTVTDTNVNDTTDVNANSTDAKVNQDYVKTDIAQVFITSDNTITKEKYSNAKIVIVDAEGGALATLSDDNAQIKIRGNSTSQLAKLPYNIKLSTSQSVLGMKPGQKWCLLANFLDKSLLRNKLAYDFALDIGVAYSSETRYVDVWLNGVYQGNYLIAVPAETGEDRVNLDTSQKEYLLELEMNRSEVNTTYITTSLCRFKLDAPEALTGEQYSDLQTFLTKAENAMASGNYLVIANYVDLNSFIDFFLIQELFKNVDVHTSSTRYYIKDDKIYAGPLWDFDLSCGNVALFSVLPYYLTYNNYGDYGNSSYHSYEGLWALNSGPSQNFSNSWIGNLMKCKEFRSELYQRYVELQDKIVHLYQDNTLGKNQISVLLEQFGDSFTRNNEKWPTDLPRKSQLYRADEKTYEENIKYLQTWLKSRNEWLLQALKGLEENFDGFITYSVAE